MCVCICTSEHVHTGLFWIVGDEHMFLYMQCNHSSINACGSSLNTLEFRTIFFHNHF